MPAAACGSVYVAGIPCPSFMSLREFLRFRPLIRMCEDEVGVCRAQFQLLCSALIVVVEHCSALGIEEERGSGFPYVGYVGFQTFPS